MRYYRVGRLIICLFPCCIGFSGPGLMGVLTLLISFLTALSVGLTRSTWYGLGIWMVYIRGLLVLFSFFCALTPNPRFKLPCPRYLVLGPVVRLFAVCECVFGQNNSRCVYIDLPPCQVFVIYQAGRRAILVWLGCYIMLTMVVVTKVAPKEGGCLREFCKQGDFLKSSWRPRYDMEKVLFRYRTYRGMEIPLLDKELKAKGRGRPDSVIYL